jgi:hypothetical protein
MEDLSGLIPLPGDQEDRFVPPPDLPDEAPEPGELSGRPENRLLGLPDRPRIRFGQWNNL